MNKGESLPTIKALMNLMTDPTITFTKVKPKGKTIPTSMIFTVIWSDKNEIRSKKSK